jgi:hypothetical protein
MNKYITDWVAENGTKADCATLGFAQCYLQFNVSAKHHYPHVKLTGDLGIHRPHLQPDHQRYLPAILYQERREVRV